MATRQFDRLNTIKKTSYSDKMKRLEDYFGEMDLPEDEIKDRVYLADDLDTFFKRLFVLLAAAMAAEQEINKQYYYDYAANGYADTLTDYGREDLAESYRPNINATTQGIVDTTFNHPDSAYYVSDERAIFLAMNESNAVLNYDRDVKAREAGYTSKVWITKFDAKVRETHKKLHNKKIGIYDTFLVGVYDMRFPLDITLGAGPEEVCNCRCVCKYSDDTADYYSENVQKLRNNLPSKYEDTRKVGKPISKERLDNIKQLAIKYDIPIEGFETYCGDPDVLEKVIVNFGSRHVKYPIRLKYDNVLGYKSDYSKIDIDAFAETKGKVITLNKFMFDDSAFLKQNYESAVFEGTFAKGTSYVNILDHEYGHVIANKDTKRYRYIYNSVINVLSDLASEVSVDLQEYIANNVSRYASFHDNEDTYSELISEMNAQLNGTANEFAASVFEKAGVIDEIR